ncbi:efflux RND transporter periplasmic adaptor subunit [Acuticoccus sp. M5D2P5]|uniref:efflux RND transporter periplasmic adaptor subunit n=1 Tax=Acuticoccus kalidii TaxID=2910977 RepID=UPI001F344163|nr:efflux RND transporter periplasmic adaptor subunit [Acuticoccus kalidii]MCF3936067.1 efflux RND transporter periplasmic adaptor subunit [Acuticoccus kalidii]
MNDRGHATPFGQLRAPLAGDGVTASSLATPTGRGGGEASLRLLTEARETTPAGPTPVTRRIGEADRPAESRPGAGLMAGRPPSRPRRPKRTLGALLVVLLLVGGAVAGVRYGLPRTAEHYPILPGMLAVELSGPATLDAINQTDVAATSAGRIIRLPVDRNDVVKAGDVIAVIKSDDLERQVAAAQASVESADRGVDEAKAQQTRAEAALQNAQESHDRLQKLVASGTVTQASYDAGLATLRQATADLTAAKAAVARAEAEHRAAISQADLQQTYLDDAVVRAPIPGVVVSRARNLGDVVSAGAPIVTIVDPGSIVMSARFDESAIASIEPGQSASLVFPSRPGTPIAGHVLRLGRKVDNETREFSADIRPDTLPPNWAIGQRGRVVVTVATKPGVLAAPTETLTRRDGQAGVWVAEGGRAHWQPVTLGAVGDGRVEVISGLHPGETVLKRARLFEGMRIQPPSASS